MRIVKTALDDASRQACSETLLHLRPHISPDRLVAQLKEMAEEGFHLIYLTADEDDTKVVTCAGYRYIHNLVNGRIIYIDDLVTLPAYQGKGYASVLLRHIKALAAEAGVQKVTLDSGHQRTTAHRLYLNHGYTITAHHFSQSLS
ncbi:GNAT family N-acetyltransferase [Chitinophaga nivalis]|uniref:GNAT family N-acetyltransferase n=1 Tax=Chitinophaga nivalis TaxID=2991709 RepID=A0ABT3IKS4_9BACT|nr:GNAT family N-acetyltransferase [Chitinophaga nivalis]MCW3465753.1 GNAT family N-acetyltransferase [Chitinophaga nivalis]MCW3484556.1 GNAT family N-acetyltransferase [Chitinophaga nivalis]